MTSGHSNKDKRSMKEPLPRLDGNEKLRERLLPLCRLKKGEIWEDPLGRHRVGVLDATSSSDVERIFDGDKCSLVVHDPPYNVTVGGADSQDLFKISSEEYIGFSRKWIANSIETLAEDSHLYIWLGADQNAGFQPLPEFMIMMREFSDLTSRSFITMRNQRGYGTSQNWMAVRQELLYYTKGKPDFKVVYTDIPKILRGYYKDVGGKRTENVERSGSENIRPGNVWVDIQQVFYRLEENVPGAYAQKPLKAIERLIATSSSENELVSDFFSHAGTTLVASERLGRRCITFDIDPVFAELSIRRLEHCRETQKSGWQCGNPFPELD